MLASRPDLTRARLERTRALMDENAEGALVIGYEVLIPALTLPDPNDRHVLAAAIESEAEIIVTWNLRDFPNSALAAYEIAAQNPDDFLTVLFDINPGAVLEAVHNQRSQLRNPPRTLAEFLETMQANRLPQFVGLLEKHADVLSRVR